MGENMIIVDVTMSTDIKQMWSMNTTINKEKRANPENCCNHSNEKRGTKIYVTWCPKCCLQYRMNECNSYQKTCADQCSPVNKLLCRETEREKTDKFKWMVRPMCWSMRYICVIRSIQLQCSHWAGFVLSSRSNIIFSYGNDAYSDNRKKKQCNLRTYIR